MSEKATDRRTLKTKKAIRDALADLLTEKELHKVTVQEIADKADINRATFYKHYLDIYDLYDKTEQDILGEIGMLVLRLEELPPEKFFTELTDHIDDNRTVFGMIFNPNGKGTLRAKFDRCMEGLFRQIEAEKLGLDLKDGKLTYQTCYRAQGCIAVISKWVMGGYKDPKDFIVKTLSELDTNTEQLTCLGPRKPAAEKRTSIFS
ncbi:MAG: TetR/AcrR family transcriptional regulator [Ruminiclostridium sp.]|nr:TetR/AcrR family transcriptional regulator [Ruminiclostridium sp.]